MQKYVEAHSWIVNAQQMLAYHKMPRAGNWQKFRYPLQNRQYSYFKHLEKIMNSELFVACGRILYHIFAELGKLMARIAIYLGAFASKKRKTRGTEAWIPPFP